MQQIAFTSNPHGKLLLQFFMDVRLLDEEKYMPGNVLEVVLKGKVLGTAKVVAAKQFRYCRINETFSFMNCGKHPAYQASLLQRYYVHELTMQPDTQLLQVVFEWQNRNIEQQRELVQDWWQKIEEAQPDHLNQKQQHA
jgi:hypothetical protein